MNILNVIWMKRNNMAYVVEMKLRKSWEFTVLEGDHWEEIFL